MPSRSRGSLGVLRSYSVPAEEDNYTFPTTTFDFPLIPDDGGTVGNDGMVNVADYGLVPNSSSGTVPADNRAALQTLLAGTALGDFSTNFMKKTLFFPNGTWWFSGLGSNTRGLIQRGADPVWASALRIQGQSEAGTILRLVDNDTDFQDAADPRFFIFQTTHSNHNVQHGLRDGTGLEGYKQIIRDLTIDLGSGNEGAAGVNVMMHNVGAIRRVTVQDSVGAGRGGTRAYAGFAEERQGAGPNHLHRLTVKGCEYGFILAGPMCGQPIEHIRLVNIGTCGLTVDANGLFVRGLKAESMTAPVAEIRQGTAASHFTADCTIGGGGLYSSSGWVHSYAGIPVYDDTMGYLLIVDASLHGTGGASSLSAIQNLTTGGKMFLRNIDSPGFARVAEEDGTPVAGGIRIDEYASPPVQNLWGQAPTSLNLPIRNTPEHPWSILAEWSSVVDLGVPITHAGSGTSATIAQLQAAIDNCTTDTLYFPPWVNGRLKIPTGTIHVRGTAKHFIGMGIEIDGTAAGQLLTIQFEHTAGAEPIVWEDIRGGSNIKFDMVLDTPRDVVFQDCYVQEFRNTVNATGTLFIEDVVTGQINLANPQDVFSRQNNADGGGLVAAYSGGDYWCFYYKAEPKANGDARSLPTTWSGRVEIVGGWMASTAGVAQTGPIWECRNSGAPIVNELSVEGFATSLGGTSGTFSQFATETQNGTTRTCIPAGNAFEDPLADRGSFNHMTLYRSKM